MWESGDASLVVHYPFPEKAPVQLSTAYFLLYAFVGFDIILDVNETESERLLAVEFWKFCRSPDPSQVFPIKLHIPVVNQPYRPGIFECTTQNGAHHKGFLIQVF